MKKYMKFMAIALAAMIALASCSEEKKRKALLPNISGKAGEVIVVIDKGNWEGAVGNVLRDSLAQERRSYRLLTGVTMPVGKW